MPILRSILLWYTDMEGMILNQHAIPKRKWRYGLRASAATGCGWIATYNALRLLGYRAKPEQLIRYFERQLPLIHGNAGTSLWGPALRLHQWGFPVRMHADLRRFDEQAKAADACILFYYWRKGLRIGSHFVALHHTQQGFIGYNTYRNSSGPDFYGDSLSAFLRKKGYFGCVLTTVRKKP